jgi:very-short-patch-repair endonuclease
MTKHTPTEQAKRLHDALLEHGITTELEYYDGYKTVDLCIKEARFYIEVDGLHHLTNADQIIADLKRDHYSDNEGFEMLHIPNAIFKNERIFDSIVEAIAGAVKKRIASTLSSHKQSPNHSQESEISA